MCLALVVLISAASLHSSSATTLSCSSNSTCPADVISCECQSNSILTWIANPPEDPFQSPPLFTVAYSDNAMSLIGDVSGSAGYRAVLLGIDTTTQTVTAQLNITLTEAVTVVCSGTTAEFASATLQPATNPSPPLNPHYVVTNSAAGNVTVRLEWEAPLDDGGAAIAGYQVSVDMSLAAVVSTDTTTILTLNSTGEYDVEIRAINTCNRTSEAAVTRIVVIGADTTATPSYTTSTTATPTNSETTPSSSSASTIQSTTFSINTCTPPKTVLSLNTAGVAGVVSAVLVAMGLVYVCGLLTGLLVRRRRKSHTRSTSGDLATPTYEQVLPPDTEQAAISLKENMAYGHFNN